MNDDRGPRPDSLVVREGKIPKKLRERDEWVCWRYEWGEKRERWRKVPKDGAGGDYSIDATNPENGVAFETALATYQCGDYDGIGIILHGDGPVAGIDYDDCRNPETDEIDQWATRIVARTDSYTEVSPSATGLRELLFGSIPDGGNKASIDGTDGTLEMYDSGRYLTVTGHHVDGTPPGVQEGDDALTAVHEEYIGTNGEGTDAETDAGGSDRRAARDSRTSSSSCDVSPSGPGNSLTDGAVIAKAKNAKNGEKFRRLWDGNIAGYPSHSEADSALCRLLAFWTGRDERQMDRLFRESGLMRAKWDETHYSDGKTYGEGTIEFVIASCTDTYSGEHNPTITQPANNRATADGGRNRVSRQIVNRVFNALSQYGPIGTADLAERLDHFRNSERQVRRALQHLESWGKVTYERDGRSGTWTVVDEDT